jgi:hypothetical protein
MEYLTEAVLVLIGGILVKVFEFFISNKKVKQDEFTKLVDQYNKDNERLRDENKMLTLSDKKQSEKIHGLEAEIKDLQHKIKLIEIMYRQNHDGAGLFDDLKGIE